MNETGVTIDADIPAGNVVLERVEGDDVFLRQDLRDTEGNWFYWHFRCRGAAGRTVRFHFAAENIVTVMGPAVSLDGGWTWSWLGPAAMDGWTFTCCFPPDAHDVRFSMGMPYTQRNLEAFLAHWKGTRSLRCDVLCASRKGRPVELLRVGDAGAAFCVLLAARHHCCEMMASYEMEGIFQAAGADDDLGRWFSENVELIALPFADKDGVEDGDQGKNRRPHDHNRDYGEPSIYPETAAVRAMFEPEAARRPTMTMDLHCPWIRGMPHNETIYQVGSSHPPIWQQQRRFGELLEAGLSGPLPYRAANDLPFGQSWNTEANFGARVSFSRWAGGLPGVRLATGIELPYAVAGGVAVTQSSARSFGRDVAQAIRQFLSTLA